MPAGGLLTAAAVSALIGGGEAIWGAVQKKKYQKQIDALNAKRPVYATNPEEYAIQNLAESRASQGMGAASKQALLNNTNNNLATSLDYALKSGADPNAIGNITQNAQHAYNQNAIYDDQARLSNLNNLQSAYARMSANRDKEFQLNQEQPWKDNMTGLHQQLTGAQNMFNSGLNLIGGGIISGASKFGSGGASSARPAGEGTLHMDPTAGNSSFGTPTPDAYTPSFYSGNIAQPQTQQQEIETPNWNGYTFTY